jgi:hypothetical protein
MLVMISFICHVYFDNALEKLDACNIQPPVMFRKSVPNLLFANDLAMGTAACIGFQKATVLSFTKNEC